VTDRFGNPVLGKSGAALQSPDTKRWAADANVLPRFPYVAGLAPAGDTGAPRGWTALLPERRQRRSKGSNQVSNHLTRPRERQSQRTLSAKILQHDADGAWTAMTRNLVHVAGGERRETQVGAHLLSLTAKAAEMKG
jgi:hypothetical protein